MHSLSLRRFAGIAFTSFALATAACGGDDSPSGPSAPAPAPADVSGTYDLTRLRALGNLGGGGNGLPVTFIGGGGATLTFNSGHLTLNADGSYELEVEAEFNGGGVTMDDQGTYVVSGSSIDFSPTGSPARMFEQGEAGGRPAQL
jgi:hypothetical protein